MYDSPILQQADEHAQQALSAPNQERLVEQFTGRRNMAPEPVLEGLFQKQRASALRTMRARLAELNARQQLHDQKMALFYKQLAFSKLQDKWARRDELGAMIGTGLGAAGMGLGGAFRPGEPIQQYDPNSDYSLDALYAHHDDPNAMLSYEPVPEWFVRQRGR